MLYQTADKQQPTAFSVSTPSPQPISLPSDEQLTTHTLGTCRCEHDSDCVHYFSYTYMVYVLCTGISNLFDILNELCKVASKWKYVGLALRLHPDTLDAIKADHQDVRSCLLAVIDAWLRKSTTHGQPSWERLVEAVAHPIGGNDYALAKGIARKHNGKHEGTPWFMLLRA